MILSYAFAALKTFLILVLILYALACVFLAPPCAFDTVSRECPELSTGEKNVIVLELLFVLSIISGVIIFIIVTLLGLFKI